MYSAHFFRHTSTHCRHSSTFFTYLLPSWRFMYSTTQKMVSMAATMAEPMAMPPREYVIAHRKLFHVGWYEGLLSNQ